MEVTFNEDHDTHAVIGGKNTKTFSIAQTAEFFTVLSKTMYSNEPLAVVREVLCNAWDAHIESDRQDQYVDVTINEDRIVFRDYGLGIHPDRIHPIYCVYGASTKKHDGNQTGGFGLGSKAPFAYSDHFTVITHHEGTKTVYAISRGSASSQGLPDLTEIVSVPTEDSGLEVSIPIKSPEDVDVFTKHIKQIVMFGGMKVKLNGTILPNLDYEKSENGIFFTKEPLPQSQHHIFVKYGNVVYPVEDHVEYSYSYDIVNNIIDKMKRDYYGTKYSCILFAEPNTISVTPSRESLSMTETSIKTIKKLLTNLINKIDLNSENMRLIYKSKQKNIIDSYYLKGRPDLLVKVDNILFDDSTINRYKEYVNLYNENDVAKVIIQCEINQNKFSRYYNKNNIITNLENIIENNYGDTYYSKLLYNRIIRQENDINKHIPVDISKYTRPLIKKLYKNSTLNVKDFYIRGQDSNSRRNIQKYYEIAQSEHSFKNAFDLIHKIVVITPSRIMLNDNYYCCNLKHIFENDLAKYVYITNRKNDVYEEALKFFRKHNFTIIDLHKIFKNITKTAISVKTPKKKTKPKGLVSLENFSINFNPRIHLDRNPDDLLYIEKPKYYIKPYQTTKNGFGNKLFSFGDHKAHTIISKFGKNTGIVTTELQVKKYVAMGAKNLEHVIFEDIIKNIVNSKKVIHKLALENQLVFRYSNQVDILNYLVKEGILNIKTNTDNFELNSEEEYYYNMFNYYGTDSGRYYIKYDYQTEFKKISEKLKEHPVAQEIINFFDNFHKNELIGILDSSRIMKFINSGDIKKENFAKTCLILALGL